MGYSNGILRVHKLYNEGYDVSFDGPFLNWSLDNYWLITLHDANQGIIREIYPIDTILGNLILTCAEDGSILVHRVGPDLEKCAENCRESKELERKQQSSSPFGGGKKGPNVTGIFKKKPKLTWEDAAVSSQFTDEKV